MITVGVIIHDNPANLALRRSPSTCGLMSEPLFGEIPILFCSPAEKRPSPYEPTSRNLGPLLMPG